MNASPFTDRALLETGAIVWIAETALAVGDAALRCRATLDPAEAAATERFMFEEDRRRSLVGRDLVRRSLSRCADVDPAAWTFASSPRGRPFVAAPAGTRLCFNLSHTRGLAACGVAMDRDIGVDVERVARHADLAALAATVFTDAECDALLALAADAQALRFAALWTLKEAYLKARGLGLSLTPKAIEFRLGDDGGVSAAFAPAAADDPSRWWFGLAEAPCDHLVAVALPAPCAAARVALRRVSPGGEDAVPLGGPWLAVSA